MKRCKAKTQAGVRCRNRATTVAYCHVHGSRARARRAAVADAFDDTREALALFAQGSASAGRKALQCVYENRGPILKNSWKGLKVLMLILSILTLPNSAEAAIENLGKALRD
ncbi:MAG: hypothetical protein PHO37_15485 [Kiritimatiellae bacterium]|nr:hypothetical protein [Kiritimatiellia bacterium]